MGEYQDLRAAMKNLFLHQLAPMPRFTRGLLGNGLGKIQVPERPDYSYVRPSRSSDEVVEVFNKEVSGGDGTPVLIGELPWQPGLTQVVGVDWATYAGVGWGSGYAGIARHGQTHQWRDGFVGTDTFNIYRRQIAPLRTYPAGSGSMSVYVFPYDYWWEGSPVSWEGLPAFDLSAARPGTGTARLMLTYLDMESNVVSVVTGSIDVYSDAIELDRPALPTGTWLPSGYVRVYGGQGTVSERDCWDARQLWALPSPGSRFVSRPEWLQNGFVDTSEVSLSWDDASMTLTIAPVGDSFRYYHHGVLFTKTDAQTSQITDNEGLWVFYFDGEGNLVNLRNPSEVDIDDAMENQAIAAYVYWDEDNDDGRLLYELHGYRMSPATHRWLHDNIGAVYKSGMALADFVIDDTGADDEDAQFSVALGEFYDEDLEFDTISASGTVGLEIWYMDGTDWRWTTNPGFSILTAGSGRMAWNDGGTQAEVDNAKFALCHVFATNITNDVGANPKCIAIQGQNEYASKAAARAGADTEINTLVYGSLPLQEIVPVATVIFQTNNGYGNAVKSRTVTTASGDNYVDWRGSDLKASGGSIADHGALAGLADDDHQQYLLADGTRALTGAWDVGAFLVMFGAGITFDGASGANVITVPDNVAQAMNLVDAGGLEFARVVSTDAAPLVAFDPAGSGGVKVGLGTITVPHGGVGYAALAMDSPNASASGPHIQTTTASDDYPLLQILSWSHDDIRVYFDSYYDGNDKSSDAGSNFLIRKQGDALTMFYDSAVAQGGAISWEVGILLGLTGNVGIGIAPTFGLLEVGGNVTLYDAAGDSPSLQFIGQTNELTSLHFDNTLSSLVVTLEDDQAEAMRIVDGGGGDNYFAIVSLDAQPEVVVNQGGIDMDFRAESVSGTHTLFVRASDGRIGMGSNAPAYPLHILTGGGAELMFESIVASQQLGLRMKDTGQEWAIRKNTVDQFLIRDITNATNPFIIEPDVATNTLYLDSTDRVGIGLGAPGAKLHVDQFSETGAIPVLTLDQADVDVVLMKIIGTAAAASANRTLVADSDFGTPGALVGWIQIEIQDDGDRIADGDYWVPFYATPV